MDGRVIFRAAPDKAGAGHPGGRLAFLADSTLLLTIGDGYDYRRGDEISQVRPGLDYGWPRTTHGVDSTGELASKEQTAQGIEPPVLVWVPSIAPSGVALYLGDGFPAWRGDFVVGGLTERSLRRVRIRNGEMVLQEVLLRELKARIRDVRTGPDGFLYLLLDDANGLLLRLRPSALPAA
jgi:glucose/arabinose dehydrogenase